MMENKCNQTPNKYLDHVYCQPSGNTYMRSNNNNNAGGVGSGGSDFLAMLKENKQLKAMLILHLDLIQEQSDQLIAKDKQIGGLKEELQAERSKSTQLELQVQELQRQLQRQIKRASVTPELSLLSPPPLAKIQCKKGSAQTSPTTNIIGECNGKLISKIVLQRGAFAESTHSPNSTTTISDTASEDATQQTKHTVDVYDIEEITTEESNDANEHKDPTKSLMTDLPRGAKPRRPLVSTALKAATTTTTTPATTPMQVCVTPPTPSRGKQMPLMLWHAPDMHSEESGSCDSVAEGDQHSTPAVSPIPVEQPPVATPTLKTKSRSTNKSATVARQQAQRQQLLPPHKHKRRCTYLTTLIEYPTREWEDEDEKVCDYEFSQAEADAIHAEAPMLEIPKWTEHDLSPSYCIEGTEDLSDESFLKRHAKLEVDEKRRKKWDVQQIREQRRVEKLKQRHYKNDIQEEQLLKSFFPQPDGLQSICFVNELPVQAFGETIPKINMPTNFMLPWFQIEQKACDEPTTSQQAMQTTTAVEIMANSATSSTSTQAQQQLTKSTFVFLKKRKRQQSSSAAGGTMATQRQRSLAATKATQQQQQQQQQQTTIATSFAAENSTLNIDSTDAAQAVLLDDAKTAPTEEEK